MPGFLSGRHFLACFGGPADGREFYVHLDAQPFPVHVTFRHEGSGSSLTVVARYRPARIYVGDQPRWVLRWVQPR